MKQIVVAGDVFIQENLFVSKSAANTGGSTPAALDFREEYEGAWRLAEFVRAAVRQPENADVVVMGPELSSAASRVVALWAPFVSVIGKKVAEKDHVWRIERLLGAKRRLTAESPIRFPETTPNPDLIAIEDRGLTFRNTLEMWPAAFRDEGNPSHIILATDAPLFEGALWRRLLGYHAERLTVIVSADALRAYGAAIRAPLSWDRTIEETAAELLGDRFANSLARVRRAIVVFGTDGAASFTRLPVLGSPENGLSDRVQFETCLYDPTCLEGSWTAKRPGVALSATGIVAAAMVRHDLEPETYPLFLALGRGLAAVRELHQKGAGTAGGACLCTAAAKASALFHPDNFEPAADFFTAFPHQILSNPALRARFAMQSDLLEDFTGSGFASVVSTGIDIVLRGIDVALEPVPKANFGKYFTVDRDEIERINSIRNLIITYLNNPKDTRPLSFAVFGPPGSGKSFAVKELMRDIAGESAASYSFNLSQMIDSNLSEAFHRIRDASVRNQIPFVFWDEFDTASLEWLKHFLCPMQDAEFHAGGVQHPFGKVIFVFAGGTAATLAAFDKTPGMPEFAAFRDKKGPDFVSRLRGHIDVKGPNPEKDATGYAYIIRRAIMLRKNLEKHAPHLFYPVTKCAAVDTSVLRAFLTAVKYQHGARSIESIVSMSNLANAPRFGAAELPSTDLLKIHVSDDFDARLKDPELGMEEIEVLGIATHEAWRATLEPGREPNSNDVPFESLPDDKKESNRSSVRSALVALASMGYRLVRYSPGTHPVSSLPDELHEPLKRLEHDRWLRELLQSGWTFGESSIPALRLNKNVLPFDALPHKIKPLDLLAVQTILVRLPELGFAMVKSE